MKSLIHLSIIGHLLHLIVGQKLASNDDSLQKACDFMGGRWTGRSQPSELAATGDTCHFVFHGQWTQDQEQSDEFCDLYTPWRLVKSTFGDTTECLVEATFICDPGWTQMFGQCFQMPRELRRMNRSAAEETCANSRQGGARIAFMHRKYIVGVWERFYRGVEQIWVDASEAWRKYEVKVEHGNEGNALGLAFTGDSYDFNVHSYSLIRVSPEIDLQVLCEYTPSVTVAEINYIGRRYSEIYWPSIPVENGILVRSGTHYSGRQDSSNMRVCGKVLKPFMARDLEQFRPSDDYLSKLTDYKPMIAFSHALGYEGDNSNSNQEKCLELNNNYKIILDIRDPTNVNNPVLNFTHPNQPFINCDNMGSSAILHTTEKAHLRTMPASMSAPMWCKVGKIKKYKLEVEDGWNAFRRPRSGLFWAHKIIKIKKNWLDAQEYCRTLGARLTGFESTEEAAFMRKITLNTTGLNNDDGLYIGGKRVKECETVAGFSMDPTSPCFREKVIAWQEGVSSVRISDDMWTYGNRNLQNPDYAGKNQHCLTLIGLKPAWMDMSRGGYLDDISCDWENYFICGKMVEVVEVE